MSSTTEVNEQEDDNLSCTDYPIVVLACLGWALITLSVLIFGSCRFVIRFKKSQENPSQGKTQATNKRYFWSCFATICGLCMTHITLSATMIFCSFGDGLLIFIASTMHLFVFWSSGVALLRMFIIRLKKVFARAVVYAYSDTTFHILAGLVICVIILGIGVIATFSLDFVFIAFLIATLCVILYLSTAFYTLYLFVYGLYRVS